VPSSHGGSHRFESYSAHHLSIPIARVMVPKQKVNREKVLAALATLWPKCGYSIPLGELLRADDSRVV